MIAGAGGGAIKALAIHKAAGLASPGELRAFTCEGLGIAVQAQKAVAIGQHIWIAGYSFAAARRLAHIVSARQGEGTGHLTGNAHRAHRLLGHAGAIETGQAIGAIERKIAGRRFIRAGNAGAAYVSKIGFAVGALALRCVATSTAIGQRTGQRAAGKDSTSKELTLKFIAIHRIQPIRASTQRRFIPAIAGQENNALAKQIRALDAGLHASKIRREHVGRALSRGIAVGLGVTHAGRCKIGCNRASRTRASHTHTARPRRRRTTAKIPLLRRTGGRGAQAGGA